MKDTAGPFSPSDIDAGAFVEKNRNEFDISASSARTALGSPQAVGLLEPTGRTTSVATGLAKEWLRPGAALDLLGDLVEEGEDLLAVDREPVADGLTLESGGDTAFPVDQRPVDVEGDPGDFARYRHAEGIFARSLGCRPRGGVAGPHRRRTADSIARAMDLLEYQGKQLFGRHGLAVSDGRAVTTVDDAVAAANAIGYPVVVKAQVPIGGRGKAGGVKLANDEAEAREHATNILGLDIKGHIVRTLWIEHASDIATEYYASVLLDRSAKKPLVMFSVEGGVDIEQVAEETPETVSYTHLTLPTIYPV